MNERLRNSLMPLLLGVIIGAGGGLGITQLRWRRHRPDPQKLTQHMTQDLSLSAEQQKAVLTILEASAAKLGDLRTRTDAEFKSIRGSTRGEIGRLLNIDQKAKFDILSAKWDERHGHGPAGEPVRPIPREQPED